MDLFEAIKERRSIREFLKNEVPQDLIEKLLEAATWAPSEGNLQTWRFYVVRNKDLKRKLARAALNQEFIAEAPLAIVVCTDLDVAASYGQRGINLYCLQSTGAAIQNLLLAAHALGLGGCWVGAFREGEVSEALKLPKKIRPVAIIPIGYPAARAKSWREDWRNLTKFID
ncbi:MAG: nitroreductase family protein [Methanocellales archaeon]